jgi:hypothetical protein
LFLAVSSNFLAPKHFGFELDALAGNGRKSPACLSQDGEIWFDRPYNQGKRKTKKADGKARPGSLLPVVLSISPGTNWNFKNRN